MLEKPNFDPWLSGAKGYLTHCLNAYDASPVWTEDRKRQVFSQSSKRTLPASGVGKPGERAAAAIADFLVVDMFANVCLGREDVKGAIAVCERQAKRLYRETRKLSRAELLLRPHSFSSARFRSGRCHDG